VIDTAVFQLPIDLDDTLLKSNKFNFGTDEINNGEIFRRMYMNKLVGGIPFGFTYYPRNPRYPRPLFMITTSLSRALHGHNALMLRNDSDIQESASKINLLLRSTFPWLSSISIEDLVLGRVDLCYDHQVGNQKQDYLKILQHLTMPYRKTFPYVELDFPDRIKLQGVEYRSLKSQNKIMFYDKWLEAKNPVARDSLRQEKKITGPRNIAQHFGIIEPPKLQHITIDKVVQLLEKDLEKLGLKDRQITDMSNSSQMLIDKYGFTKARPLIGHLTLRQSMTREQMIERGATTRTIQNDEKLILDAGVSTSTTDEYVTLLPLSIVY
jgi:hypothetical protein